MLLTERLQAAEQHRGLQLFATDIDEAALSFARAALYPDNIAADVSPERLRRWFSKEDNGYRVAKPIRESVVFATQNLIKDPPFSKLDLISCRNLLIYLEPEAQQRAIALFHFALKEGGYLLLGNSETIGQANELFVPVSKKWRLYQRIGAQRLGLDPFSATPRDHQPLAEPRAMGLSGVPATRIQMRSQQATLAEITQAQVLRDYAPACVVINRRCKVQHFFGPTAKYLEQPGGAPTQDLLSMARKGLRTKLRSAVERVLAGDAISSFTAHISRDGHRQAVRAVARPLHLANSGEELLLAFFDSAEAESKEVSAEGGDELLLDQLEHELKATRQDLQGTIEELESANEELKTANEELKTANEEAMSMNEELQSSNEEMETSKEELQSLNEELSTVNSELQLKIEEVETTNNDLTNLLAGTDMATIFLDPQCRIRRFTPATTQLFNLIASDVGRPISDISDRFAVDDLRASVERVVLSLAAQESEVRTTDSRWFIRRIMPYRTLDQRVNGVVVTFSDITTLKQIEQALHVTDKRFRALYDDNPSMYFTLDSEGVILSVNRFGAEQLGYTAEALEGSSYFLLHEMEASSLSERLQACLQEADQVHRWEAQLKTRNGDLLWTRGTARAVSLAPGKSSLFIACENIVEEKKLYAEVSYHANHDAMTGLVNRRRFEEMLTRAALTAVESNDVHALLFLDLDQFKVVNDTAGHQAGDQMLQQVAQLMRRTVRQRDVVGRLGGDEFAVLMEHCSAEEAQRLAHALLTAIRDFRFIWEGQNLWAGASIGLVAINAESGGVTGILRSADIACYKAKESGRDGVEIYAESDAGLKRMRSEMGWVPRIHHALEENLFQLYGQQIVPTSGPMDGLHFEVLLRLVETPGVVISAQEFIPAVERYSLGNSVDRWVLSSTLSALAARPNNLLRIDTCTINLSAQSLIKEDFVGYAVSELKRSGVPAAKICFEITETAAITNLPQAQHFIAALRALGCRFSLDDFGSGLSSFQYLKMLDVDYVKIDGAFVRNFLSAPGHIAIVKSINEIAHALGKQTIAESVEDVLVRDKLREMGVDYVQGIGIGLQQPMETLFNGSGF